MEFTFDPKTNQLNAVSLVRSSRQHVCECGARFEFTVDWPEGLTQVGPVDVSGVHCPECSRPVALPAARYWTEGFQLCSGPLS